MVASRQRRKHESRKISIVGNRKGVTISEDREDFIYAAVQWSVERVDPRNSYNYLQLLVMSPIIPITNPNPVSGP
jgi:hypothetical protein